MNKIINPIRIKASILVSISLFLLVPIRVEAVPPFVSEQISVSPMGLPGNQDSYNSVVSENGRYVAFTSEADNLVTGSPSDGNSRVYLRDRQTGTTEIVGVSSSGAVSNTGDNSVQSISDDGRYVLFVSAATNLVSNDTNGHIDYFIRDRSSGTTSRIDSNGSYDGLLSGDGNYVTFTDNSNLVLLNIASQTTTTINSSATAMAINTSGQYVVYWKNNGYWVYDRVNNTNTNFVNSSGGGGSASISGDGRFVVYQKYDSLGYTSPLGGLFLYDQQLGTTTTIAANHAVNESGVITGTFNEYGRISADGRFVVFSQITTINQVEQSSSMFIWDSLTGHDTKLGDVPNPKFPDISDNGDIISYHTTRKDVPNPTGGEISDYSDVYVVCSPLAASTGAVCN